MGKKGKKQKNMEGTKGNPLFRSDTFVLKGDGCKVMAASGSVDANLQDSIGVDTTLISCNNIEINVNNGGIIGGVYHNGNLATDGNQSSEIGGEMMMAADFVSTDTGVEEMAPGLENDASCEMVARGSEKDACCEMVAAGSKIHTSLEGMTVGPAATDDASRHPNQSGSKPGLRLNLNNIEVNIQSGVDVHIGGVYHNCAFHAGGTPSGANVAMSSDYADLETVERMVTGPEVAQLRRLLDVWNNSGTHLNRSNIKVNVQSGSTVNIGCVFYNTNFVAGGSKPTRPTVANESSRASQCSSDAAATAPTRPLGNRASAPGPSAK